MCARLANARCSLHASYKASLKRSMFSVCLVPSRTQAIAKDECRELPGFPGQSRLRLCDGMQHSETVSVVLCASALPYFRKLIESRDGGTSSKAATSAARQAVAGGVPVDDHASVRSTGALR